jgi:hypothetical protein
MPAHEAYAVYFRTMGQAEEAIAQLGVMYCRGRQCRQTLELDPAFEIAHWCLGLGYESKGMYEKAIAELQIAVASGGCPAKRPRSHTLMP